MKIALAILLAVVAVSSAQNRDPRTAAILAEARYLSGDGSFGAAYVQEDGTDFKEETDADGTRKGSYSYIDPNGKKITINYTAGKNGFQVSGDHLPKAPAPLPVPAQHQPQAPAQRSYQPQPQQYNNQHNDDGQYNHQYDDGQYNHQYDDGQYNNYNNNNNNNINNYQQQAYVQPATTQSPTYFPAGKINLNRNNDGYQYSFTSQQ